MSHTRSDGGIDDEDLRICKVFKVLNCDVCITFYQIFLWGCDKDEKETVEDYLKKKLGMTSNGFIYKFPKYMNETIRDNPKGDKFDVSLLYACIKHACKGLPCDDDEWKEGDDTKLGPVCTSIKNYRNNFIHNFPSFPDDAKMKCQLGWLQDKLEKAYTLAAALYSPEPACVDTLIQEMKNSINKIENARLSVEDKARYHKDLKEIREKQKDVVKKVGPCELSRRYKNVSKIDPAAFIPSFDPKKGGLEVSKIFTEPEIVLEPDDRNIEVDYKTILELKAKNENQPTIILVEGETGAGKTTLTKLILDNWADLKDSGDSPDKDSGDSPDKDSGDSPDKDPGDSPDKDPGDSPDKDPGDPPNLEGLGAYQLVLYTEARNPNICSFLSLLKELLPHTSYDISDDELEKCVLDVDVLLVIDGLEESTNASRKLMKEVFEKLSTGGKGKLRLVITTTPAGLSDHRSLLPDVPLLHIVLKGIKQDKGEEFIRKLHNEMRRVSQSDRETEDLVNLVKQSQTHLGELYRFPLNLTLLTYLFALSPDKVNSIRSCTSLYRDMHELIKSRALKIVQDRQGGAPPPPGLLKRGCAFLKRLYDVCLQTHASRRTQLSTDSTEKLKSQCSDMNLPFDEVCSAFLSVSKIRTPEGYKDNLFLSHASTLEFYTANRILWYKIESLDEDSLPRGIKRALVEYGDGLSEENKNKMLELSHQKLKDQLSLTDIMKSLGIDFEEGKLSHYQNVFLLLSGLLAHTNPSWLHEYAEELVDLLSTANKKDSHWLKLVAETACDEKMAELAAAQFTKIIKIRDNHVEAGRKVIKYLPTNISVSLYLENDESNITQLNDLLDELSGRNLEVDFRPKYRWKSSRDCTSDELLKRLTKSKGDDRCKVSSFRGHLQNLDVVPPEVTKLAITFANSDHAEVMCSQLVELTKRQELHSLGAHVMKGVSPSKLRPLPVDKAKSTLWLSDVQSSEDVTWACEVARALLPEGRKYSSIMFPRSSVSSADCEALLEGLKTKGVQVQREGGLRICCSHIDGQLDELKEQAKNLLNCKLHCSGNQSSMW